MKRTLVIIGIVAMLAMLVGSVTAAEQCKYGGFDVTVNHVAPGSGTFSIIGENVYGSVDVAGSFTMVVDRETKEWTCTVVFDAESIVITADGEIHDISAQELTFSGGPGPKKVVFNIVNYIKSILEG